VGQLLHQLRRAHVAGQVGDDHQVEAVQLQVVEDGGAKAHRARAVLLLCLLHRHHVVVAGQHLPRAALGEELRGTPAGGGDGTHLQHPSTYEQGFGKDVPGQQLALAQAAERRRTHGGGVVPEV